MPDPTAGLTLPQLRQAVDDLLWEHQRQTHQLATAEKEKLANLTQRWQQLKPSVPIDYWPIIEDRLDLLSRLN